MLAAEVFLFGKKNIPLRDLKEKGDKSPKSVHIPNPVVVSVDCEAISVDGGIESLDPLCLGFAYSGGHNPFTNSCKNWTICWPREKMQSWNQLATHQELRKKVLEMIMQSMERSYKGSNQQQRQKKK